MRLPVGIQDFIHLRESDYVYVDKTMYLPGFLEGGRFFLARPRRFGKSILLSTLAAVFQGRKDVFRGLWLEHHHDFVERPVIRLDFSNVNFSEKTLSQGLVDWLRIDALRYGYEIKSDNGRDAFRELILELSKTTKVVILIDEYDKPITDYLLNAEKRSEYQTVLKNLYGVLKPLDAHIHLVFLTGVSKIGKLSLFSDLNNLQDISLNQKYAQLCGYSKSEIELHFVPWLESIAVVLTISMPVLWQAITFWYNGYSWDAIHKLFCPFSFLLFLENQEFRSFWYETGTPTFLVKLVKNAQFNPMQFEAIALDEMTISSTNIENLELSSLMFQTGYLTMVQKTRNTLGTRYQLSYPNEEVRQAFAKSLLLEYNQQILVGSFSLELQDSLLALNWNGFFAVVNKLFMGIPYEIFPAKEIYVHSLMHLMLVSSGWRTQSQIQSALGRLDTLVETATHSLIFEFKISNQANLERIAEKALLQIEIGQYGVMANKPVVKIAAVFNSKKKQMTKWKVELVK
jgi:hypothetical protein